LTFLIVVQGRQFFYWKNEENADRKIGMEGMIVALAISLAGRSAANVATSIVSRPDLNRLFKNVSVSVHERRRMCSG